MAERFCRILLPEVFDAFFAGIKQHGLNPRAVMPMDEVGSDESRHVSKTVDIHFENVVTVCDSARETCPFFPPE
jgi:arsenate reductase (thioredoxin)